MFPPRTQTPTSLIAFKWKYRTEQTLTCRHISFADKNKLSRTRLNNVSLYKDCFDVGKRPLDWAQRKSRAENAWQLCLSGPCDGNKHKSRWIEKTSERIKAGASQGKGKRTTEPWRESETCQIARQEVAKDRVDHPLLAVCKGGRKNRMKRWKKRTDIVKDTRETDSRDVYLKSVSLSSPLCHYRPLLSSVSLHLFLL